MLNQIINLLSYYVTFDNYRFILLIVVLLAASAVIKAAIDLWIAYGNQ